MKGLATLSFDRYKIAQTLLGRSCILCFETVHGMTKNTPTPSPPLSNPQKLKKYLKTFFYINDILRNFFKGVGVSYLLF